MIPAHVLAYLLHSEDAQLLLSETEQIETEFVVGLSRDRAQRIQKVATDTLSVHSMFAQLSDLVASASAVFDDLEANVTAVRDDTVQAQKDLEQSNRYLLAKRQRMCCLICCLVLVMIVVGICLSIVTK
jgi:syntaxin 1A/syntaxin 1B/2/3